MPNFVLYRVNPLTREVDWRALSPRNKHRTNLGGGVVAVLGVHRSASPGRVAGAHVPVRRDARGAAPHKATTAHIGQNVWVWASKLILISRLECS